MYPGRDLYGGPLPVYNKIKCINLVLEYLALE